LGSRAREERVQSSNEGFPQGAFFVLAMYSQKEKKKFFFAEKLNFFWRFSVARIQPKF
jgi:hypothetical protein